MITNITRRSLFGAILLTTLRAASRPLRIVVVGAHPDDPESGCGGTMALCAAQGHSVTALYLTRGQGGIEGKERQEAGTIRTREAEEACRILGAQVAFDDQMDGATEITGKTIGAFNKLLLERNPDVVLTHWPIDTHQDHSVASLLTLGTWRGPGGGFALYFYEVLTGFQTGNFSPTDYIDITSVEAKKRAACFAHVSQKPKEFYSHHVLMSESRGAECHKKYAEAFMHYSPSRRIEIP